MGNIVSRMREKRYKREQFAKKHGYILKSKVISRLKLEIEQWTASAKQARGGALSEYANVHISASMDGFRVYIKFLEHEK